MDGLNNVIDIISLLASYILHFFTLELLDYYNIKVVGAKIVSGGIMGGYKVIIKAT